MAHILGLDIGERKIGVAVADQTSGFAFAGPALLVRTFEDIWPLLAAIITQDDIAEIVVGVPLNADQTAGPQAERVRTIIDQLKQFHLPVHERNEYSTSVAVQREQQLHGRTLKRGEEDSLAAQLILESFLQETRS